MPAMGRKSSAKGQTPRQPTAPTSSKPPLFVFGLVAVVVLAGATLYFRGGSNAPSTSAADVPQRPPIASDLKPHPQANLPALQFPGYQMPRSADVVTAAYKFAAEHPEVLSYVPCFCGCERSGHRGNEDCFVKSRDVNGDVVEWEEHGMDCAVCIDVATRAKALFTQGKSVEDIRSTIDKEWSGRAQTHTPTPEAPHQH
jgi:hypothetical protein